MVMSRNGSMIIGMSNALVRGIGMVNTGILVDLGKKLFCTIGIGVGLLCVCGTSMGRSEWATLRPTRRT